MTFRLPIALAAVLVATAACSKAEEPKVSEATIERFILKQERAEATEKANAVDDAEVRAEARAPKDERLIEKAKQDTAADKQQQRR